MSQSDETRPCLAELPRYQTLQRLAQRFPALDPAAIGAYLVLLRLTSELAAARDAHFARHDLSEGRFMVLIQLYTTTGPLSPAELAERIGVTRATMTGLLDTLEHGGAVQRTPHPSDGRGLAVHLTEAGRARLEAMLPDHYRRLSALLAPLSTDERETLVALLDKLRQALPALGQP